MSSSADIALRRARAVALYRDGRHLREIGEQLGVTHEMVRRYLIDQGEPLRLRWRQPRITDRNRDITETYLRGDKTMREVALQYGIAECTVRGHIAKYRAMTGGKA